MRYQAGTDRGRDVRNPQPEDLLGFADAPKLELSEGFQASVAASRGLCEPRGKKEMAVEHIAKLLHSNDFVEPIRSADIAVQHFPDVECDVDLREGQPFRLAPQVPRLDLFQGLCHRNFIVRRKFRKFRLWLRPRSPPATSGTLRL
jgi:hypothetical protein